MNLFAALRQDPASMANWDAIVDLQNKLPTELADVAEPIRLDPVTLSTAIEEAEALLLARLSVSEVL